MAPSALFPRLLALPPALRCRALSTASRLASTTSSPETYDVVCIGGGPAGLSFVSALKSHPSTQALKVAIIDSQKLAPVPTPSDDAFSNRCSSLTPASLRFLQTTGAWDHLDEARTAPYHAMDVWDGVSGSKIHFDPLDQQRGLGVLDSVAQMIPGSRFKASRRKYDMTGDEGVVATMCENSNLTSALLRRVEQLRTEEQKDVKLLDSTKVDSIDLGPESPDEKSLDLSQWPVVTTSTGDKLAARLLVGADGANSPVRTFADIPSHGWDYNQHGVVTTLSLDQPFSSEDMRTAYQRFLPTGPIALLPLPGNRASLVWSTTPSHAATLKSLPSAEFIAMANAAFRLMPVDINFMVSPDCASPSDELSWRLPATSAPATGLPMSLPTVTSVQEGSVASFPLRMRHASTYTGHRVALIGDAAHTIHPLAGQGLNLGLADSEALFNQIVYGMRHGMDIGSCWCLDGYNSERWAKNNAVMGVVDKLQKVYSAGSGPVVWGRSAGVEVLERLGGLKGMIMGGAGGGMR